MRSIVKPGSILLNDNTVRTSFIGVSTKRNVLENEVTMSIAEYGFCGPCSFSSILSVLQMFCLDGWFGSLKNMRGEELRATAWDNPGF